MTGDSPAHPDVPSPAIDGRRARFVCAALVALFFLSSLAVLPMLARYRGDEHFYTDAAIRMVQTGDWITPYYADGSLRFRKPILPYWIVAVPFQLAGIGIATSRLGALIAASVTLLLTYRLTMILSANRRQALLATAIMLSNPHLMNMATRATTDALLVACSTLALVGLSGLLFDRRRTIHLACFWLGIGLVAASKGGLAVALLAFAIGFVAWRGRYSNARLRDLLHWPSMLAALVIGLGWFAIILLKHGHVAWADFWADQVGNRMTGGGSSRVLKNLGNYLVAIPINSAPWSLLLFVAGVTQWPAVRRYLAQRRERVWFAAGWYALLVVLFALGNIQRNRYCLPAYPPTAAITAGLFLRLWDQRASASRAAQWMAILIAGAGVVGLAFVAIGWRVDRLIALGGGVTALMAVVALFAWRFNSGASARADLLRQSIVLAIFILLVNRVNDGITRQPLFPASGPDLLRAIETHADARSRVAAAGLAPGQQAQARLLSRGTRTIDPLPIDASVETLARYDTILFAPGVTPPPGYATAPAAMAHSGWRVSDLIAVGLGRRDRAAIDARRITPYSIAWRSTAGTRPATTQQLAPEPRAPGIEDAEE